MKITNIAINNMLGINAASIELNKPVLLIAGANGAGKSSIGEAIKHALVAECDRVQHKKDFGRLVHDNADAGHAFISTTLGDFGIILPEGKQTGPEGLPFGIEYCLTPRRFAELPAADKRSFLFKLMKVKATPQAIIAKLASRGISAGDIDEITPHLHSGFEAANKEAQGRARDAKASWRAITGETYGSVKAATWEAPSVELDGALLVETRQAIEALENEIAGLNGELGALNEQAKNHAQSNALMDKLNSKMNELREHAGKFARIQDKLNRDLDELKTWEAKVKDAEAAANGEPYNEPLTCPHCSGLVVMSAHEHMLEEYEGRVEPDAEAAAKLPEYRKARDLLQSAVTNGQRDLAAAENAARHLDELENETAPEPVSADKITLRIAEVTEALREAKAKRTEQADALAHYEQVERDSKAAAQKTSDAKGYHADVVAWDLMADALAPGGIPAELLNEALEPFNGELQWLADHTGWPAVALEESMELMVGGRYYALRSESERWRADTMIALAIAKVSGSKIAVLDRFDVLDLNGRSEAFYLFDDLTADGTLDTVVLIGTLKALPAHLLDNMQAVWVEHGQVKSLAEAA